jgi:hypothetical protein
MSSSKVEEIRAQLKRNESRLVHLKRKAKRSTPEERKRLGGAIRELRVACATDRKRLAVRSGLFGRPRA